MANLLIWWRQRTPSEQRLLLGLTGLLAACAFWYGLWQPWRAREAQWRQTLVKEQASLRWMTEQAPRLQQLSQQPAPAAKEALTALVMREDVKQRINAEGGDAITSTPEEYAADIERELAKWGALISKLNLRVN